MESVREQQRARLKATIAWAERIRATLGPTLKANGERVHFRPASGGIAMVGLLPDRPQRGKSAIRDLQKLADTFDVLFTQHCVEIDHGRITGEKALQSFLIRDAQTHDGRLHAINEASRCTSAPVELVFVTDEIALPVEGGKIVCDVLALRVDGDRSTPLLLELKDSRQLTRLVEQVEAYAELMDTHGDLFAELYSALLGRAVRFTEPTEKWIVWPAAGETEDPREHELAARDIRLVGHYEQAASYRFRVGERSRGREQ